MIILKHLNEVSRRNLVGKTKVFSPARYDKRLRYSAMSIPEIDEDELLNNDMLVLSIQVGSYTDTIAYRGVIKRIVDIAKHSRDHRVNRRLVVRVLNEQIDLTDVYVRCSCPDFKMRYAYWCSRYNCIYGDPERRPANITNPHDDIGATCKHLCAVLSNKKWLVKAAPVVNDFIHNNYEEILKRYKLSANEFVIDDVRYNAMIPTMIKNDLKRPPAELLGAAGRLYDADNIGFELEELLSNKGWFVRVDEDLGKPIQVFLSKSAEALDNVDDISDNVYIFDVVPAGTKVRLKRVISR